MSNLNKTQNTINTTKTRAQKAREEEKSKVAELIQLGRSGEMADGVNSEPSETNININNSAIQPIASLAQLDMVTPSVGIQGIESADSDGSVYTAQSRSPADGRFWGTVKEKTARQHPSQQSIGFSSESEAASGPPKTIGKRQPLSQGSCIGLFRAKAKLNTAKKEECRFTAEQEVEKLGNKIRSNRAKRLSAPVIEGKTAKLATDLNKCVLDSVTLIHKIATTSSNLKGTWVRDVAASDAQENATAYELRQPHITPPHRASFVSARRPARPRSVITLPTAG